MKEFLKIMDQIAYRWHKSQVFDDFLQMAVCAFSLGRMEKIYQEHASRYNEAEIKLFATAMAAMIEAYETEMASDGTWTDVLGKYFEEINSSSTASSMGQFFTPVEVCNLMAKILINPKDEYPKMVNDPTCGSSRNLIAHARMEPNNRLRTMYIGQDMDRRCVLMSVINFVMYGMRGYVIHCDTLKLEFYGGYRVFLPETGLMVKPLTAEEARSVMITSREKAPEQVIEKPIPELIIPDSNVGRNGQLQLF